MRWSLRVSLYAHYPKLGYEGLGHIRGALDSESELGICLRGRTLLCSIHILLRFHEGTLFVSALLFGSSNLFTTAHSRTL